MASVGTAATPVRTSGAISVFAPSEHIKKGWEGGCVASLAGGGGGRAEGAEPGVTGGRMKRRADRRRGPTERFSFLNLHFFFIMQGGKEVKVKDGKGDGGEKDVT